MKIDTYKSLTYEEDERMKNPSAFYHSGKGNRKCQHVHITDKRQIQIILDVLNLANLMNDNLSFSILWNFPRKKYNEDQMWVCMSGYTYSNEYFNPNSFVVSDNVVTDYSQKIAMEVLDTLNKLSDITVSYPND